MIKAIIKRIFIDLGLNLGKFKERLGKISIGLALSEIGLTNLTEDLRKIIPDISNQEESIKDSFNDYWELKRRGLQAFQCKLMSEAIRDFSDRDITVVDVGDSAGTHMLYLKEFTRGRFNIDTLSVNLDQRAIDKIKARGLKALLCRAEDLNLNDKKIDLIVSFQMVEHLYNPAIFFRRLAKKTSSNRMAITVPYLRQSRVGLYNIRNKSNKTVFAEDEHIFELSPDDWTLLMLHSGWRVSYSKIYYQYPKRWPIFSQLLAWYWRQTDFEGFWGAILEKDTVLSDHYQDWEQ